MTLPRPILPLLAILAVAAPALAQTPPAKPTATKPAAAGKQAGTNPLALGANSKEPIKIDADRLDVFDKESRAVFAGNVVAVQGETTVRCTTMTIYYEPRGKGAQVQPAADAQANRASGGPPNQNDSSIRKIDCAGPVSVISKTQTATGDNATFDRAANKVILTGNVALADGQNITRGERLVYDTVTGVANVETTPGGRVKGLFIPGSANSDAQGGGKPKDKAAPPRAKPASPASPTN